MTTKEYIDEAEQHLLHTYNRYQIVLEKGDGVYLYDTDGKKYLDFAAGIAVFAFGYNNQEYNDALKGQIDKSLLQCSFCQRSKKIGRDIRNGQGIFYKQWYRGNRGCY